MKVQPLSKREYHEYQGKVAKVAVLNRLVNWPKARMLAGEICDFYGDYLQYYENSACGVKPLSDKAAARTNRFAICAR